jgi:hypothetical protein
MQSRASKRETYASGMLDPDVETMVTRLQEFQLRAPKPDADDKLTLNLREQKVRTTVGSEGEIN